MITYSTFACSKTIAFFMMSVILCKELVFGADECCWLFRGGEMTPFSLAELLLLLLRWNQISWHQSAALTSLLRPLPFSFLSVL